MNDSFQTASQAGVDLDQPQLLSVTCLEDTAEKAVGRHSFTVDHGEKSPSSVIEPKQPSRHGIKRRYWWIGVCAIIIAILLLVVWQLGLLTGDSRTQPTQKMLLEDILGGKYSPKKFNGTWESDALFSYKSEQGHVMLYDVITMTSSNVADNDTIMSDEEFEYEFSADLKYFILSANKIERFGKTVSLQLALYDVDNQTMEPIFNSQGYEDNEAIQEYQWAPVGNSFLYRYHDNIYYRPVANDVTEYAITNSGVAGISYDGFSYSTIDESGYALAFSSNATRLAFATYDFSEVKEQPIVFYGAPGENETHYAQVLRQRFTKVGEKHPNVTIRVVDLTKVSTENLSFIDIPIQHNLRELLLIDLMWANDEEVVMIWVDRILSKQVITICNCSAILDCKQLWKQEVTNGTVDTLDEPKFSSDGSRVVFTASHEQDGDVGEFRHVTLIVRGDTENQVVALTSGVFTVTEILDWDDENDQVFFTATTDDAASQHVFSVSSVLADAPHAAHCISCGQRTEGGDIACQYNTASYSEKFSFYMLHCIGPDVPQIAIYNKDHMLVTMWEDNQELRATLQDMVQPQVLYLQVPIHDDHVASVKLWLPPNMDLHAKHPLIVDVYAGPDSQQITHKFEVDWSYYLTTSKSMVYANIDGRGSAQKGNRISFATFKRLGTVEVEDQLYVTKYLLQKYLYLDSDRTAIFGWSYGGFHTLTTLATDTADVFKCGISVAPVTDWTHYLSWYSERWMGYPTPQDNLNGYNQSNINNKIEKFRNKTFLLIHGTADDNVHVQHAMMFARALQKKNILFKQQIYPDENHDLSGVTLHVYLTMTEFLEECFNRKTWRSRRDAPQLVLPYQEYNLLNNISRNSIDKT